MYYQNRTPRFSRNKTTAPSCACVFSATATATTRYGISSAFLRVTLRVAYHGRGCVGGLLFHILPQQASNIRFPRVAYHGRLHTQAHAQKRGRYSLSDNRNNSSSTYGEYVPSTVSARANACVRVRGCVEAYYFVVYHNKLPILGSYAPPTMVQTTHTRRLSQPRNGGRHIFGSSSK